MACSVASNVPLQGKLVSVCVCFCGWVVMAKCGPVGTYCVAIIMYEDQCDRSKDVESRGLRNREGECLPQLLQSCVATIV